MHKIAVDLHNLNLISDDDLLITIDMDFIICDSSQWLEPRKVVKCEEPIIHVHKNDEQQIFKLGKKLLID